MIKVNQSNKKNSPWPDTLIKRVTLIWDRLKWVFREMREGFKHRTFPAHYVGGLSFLLASFILFGLDYRSLRAIGLASLYPFKPFFYWIWVILWVILIPYFGWGWIRVNQLRKMLKALGEIFKNNGLVTLTGKMPGYISDKAIEGELRELRLTMNGIPKSKFEGVKEQLGTALHGYLEEIRENRTLGELIIRYARSNIPEYSVFDDPRGYPANSFVVGDTRTERLIVSLQDVPHLLIAGATTSGKSTFLRQMVTTLYFCNPAMKFIFLDFKGKVEGNDFERLDRIEVHGDLSEALGVLEKTTESIQERLELLNINKVKNIDEFHRKKLSDIQWTKSIDNLGEMQRLLLVIDEAAMVFLANALVNAEQVSQARRNAAIIAAQGRAVGIHLVISTQRPDVKAVDGMIKANLVGRLSFAMADNASSMTILDSVRAADLPPSIKGRAIWRDGNQLTEVQVPHFKSEILEKWVGSLRRSIPDLNKKQENKSVFRETEKQASGIFVFKQDASKVQDERFSKL